MFCLAERSLTPPCAVAGVCVPILECEVDDHCANIKYCELANNTCADPCVKWPCGPNSFGTPIDHR